jgi:hypothetical protein
MQPQQILSAIETLSDKILSALCALRGLAQLLHIAANAARGKPREPFGNRSSRQHPTVSAKGSWAEVREFVAAGQDESHGVANRKRSNQSWSAKNILSEQEQCRVSRFVD